MVALGNNIIIYISSIMTCLSYCYYISSKLPKGKYRFISLVPIFYIFTILPLRCSSLSTTAVTFAFTTWLTNFKLIRFAFDLDQSPFHPSYSLLHFITFTSLPIKTRITNPTLVKSSRFKLGFQFVIFSILVQTVLNYKNHLHPKIISFIYGWLLFLLIDIIAAMVNTILLLLTGLELEPSSDQPYLATSLQSFWGKWNLLVTKTLRHTIYKPVHLAFPNRKWAPLAGILASFIVSGLMHELYVYHLSRAAPTWEMTSFFVLHGICVVVEMVVKRSLVHRQWRLPDFIAMFLTNAFVVVTGVWLFIPPFVKNHLDVKWLQEYTLVADFIKNKYSQIYV